jgi:hypothetical protein
MAKISTRSNKLSGVLAFEEFPEKGFCREVVTVTMQAGMDIGAVLQLVSGKYVWVTQASATALLATPALSAAADLCVLIDHAKDPINLPAGDASLAVLYRGSAGVVDSGLKYKDVVTAGDKAALIKVLSTKGIVGRVAAG